MPPVDIQQDLPYRRMQEMDYNIIHNALVFDRVSVSSLVGKTDESSKEDEGDRDVWCVCVVCAWKEEPKWAIVHARGLSRRLQGTFRVILGESKSRSKRTSPQ